VALKELLTDDSKPTIFPREATNGRLLSFETPRVRPLNRINAFHQRGQ